jgi:thiol-disulfide isomerase/thioredoxin
MEKWKIAVIVLLLGALGGYGFYQQNRPTISDPPQPAPGQPTPPPANQRLLKLKGQTPPTWNIPSRDWINTPRPISLADLKGHVALIEFWRMECSHCQEAAPHMNQLFKQYTPRGVKFVAIHSPGAPGAENPENDWDKVQQRIKEWGLQYPIAFDENGKLFKSTYGGDTYPAMLILNRAGKVAYINNGYTSEKEAELRQALDKTLKAKQP